MKSFTQSPAPLRWLLRVMGKWKRFVVLLLLIQIALALCGVATAWIAREIVNQAASRSMNGFAQASAVLILLQAVLIALRAAWRFLREYTESGVENRLKDRLFSTLLTRDFAAVTAVHTGEWMSRLTSDVSVTAKGAAEIIPDAVGALVRMTAAALLLIVLIPALAVPLPLFAAALIALTRILRRQFKTLHRRQQEAEGRVRVQLLESLSGLLIVRAFSREDAIRRQAAEAMDEHRKARLRRNRFSNLCNAGFGAVMDGARAFGVIYCAWRILRGEMTYGTLVAAIQLIGQIQGPFANLSGYPPRYYAALASAERLMEAEFQDADNPPRRSVADTERFYRETFTALCLRRAEFSYRPPLRDSQSAQENAVSARNSASLTHDKASPVLRNVSFTIRKGEFVALTGVSGRGKSTLLKLLLSLYPLDDGERLLLSSDGPIPLDASWRRLFAYVPQGNQLMSGTVREAVAFGDPDAMRRDAELWGALSIACAAEFVRERPEGLDARLGERGQGFSEGQLQRLAIARAIFSGRPILLLDEATSALDEELEARLLRNLRRMTDCTVLIVTHRPAALDVCDREIRLEESGVREFPSERKRRP